MLGPLSRTGFAGSLSSKHAGQRNIVLRTVISTAICCKERGRLLARDDWQAGSSPRGSFER
jgi:hypothetical protein